MNPRQYRFPSRDGWAVIDAILEKYREEGIDLPYTMEDFRRDYIKEHFAKLPPEVQEEVLRSLPPERRLAGLSVEKIRQYLDQLTSGRPARPRKSRRKK
jgi:hypothetical protein